MSYMIPNNLPLRKLRILLWVRSISLIPMRLSIHFVGDDIAHNIVWSDNSYLDAIDASENQFMILSLWALEKYSTSSILFDSIFYATGFLCAHCTCWLTNYPVCACILKFSFICNVYSFGSCLWLKSVRTHDSHSFDIQHESFNLLEMRESTNTDKQINAKRPLLVSGIAVNQIWKNGSSSTPGHLNTKTLMHIVAMGILHKIISLPVSQRSASRAVARKLRIGKRLKLGMFNYNALWKPLEQKDRMSLIDMKQVIIQHFWIVKVSMLLAIHSSLDSVTSVMSWDFPHSLTFCNFSCVYHFNSQRTHWCCRWILFYTWEWPLSISQIFCKSFSKRCTWYQRALCFAAFSEFTSVQLQRSYSYWDCHHTISFYFRWPVES